MANKKIATSEGFFQNTPEYFQVYKGKIISAEDIKTTDLTGLKVAVIGANQLTVTLLNQILKQAEYVKVLQIAPHFVLPQTENTIQKMIDHPLISKNRRLFNNRIKSLLAIRYLESQVSNIWLKRQLMPNSAAEKKVFFKSDSYYSALQKPNCKLITWPVVKITENAVQSMEGIEHLVDVIITTY